MRHEVAALHTALQRAVATLSEHMRVRFVVQKLIVMIVATLCFSQLYLLQAQSECPKTRLCSVQTLPYITDSFKVAAKPGLDADSTPVTGFVMCDVVMFKPSHIEQATNQGKPQSAGPRSARALVSAQRPHTLFYAVPPHPSVSRPHMAAHWQSAVA